MTGGTRRAAPITVAFLVGLMSLVTAAPSGMTSDDGLPIELTLTGPTEGDPGDVLEFEGQLTLQGVGVPLQDVEILRDGEPVATATTDVDGAYVFELEFAALGQFELAAVADVATLLEATSPILAVSIWQDLPLGGASVETGFSHSCVALADGTVYCWGSNGSGQLGDGTNIDRLTATLVPGLANVVSLSAGAYSMCALISDGTVSCWGDNEYGQLGDGTTTNRNTPVQVLNLSGVLELGSSDYRHTCAIVFGGTAACWGWNQNGQLGDGTTTDRYSAVAVADLANVESIAAGSDHTCAVAANSTVYCWGNNVRGQLGDGTTTARMEPTPVIDVPDGTAVGAGYQYSCAISSESSLYCWGSNSRGQLGNGRTKAAELPGLSGLSDVATVDLGFSHTCATKVDGSPHCWGNNDHGQIGDDTMTLRTSPVPVPLTGIDSIAAGLIQSCAAGGDGGVWCWGANTSGQVGDGSTASPITTPTAVVGLPN